jgi:DNA-binding CsgD family transcriptional regulator
MVEESKSGPAQGTSLEDRIAMAQAGMPLAAKPQSSASPSPSPIPAAEGHSQTPPPLQKAAVSSSAAGIAGDGVSDVAELARLLNMIRQTEAQEGTLARSIVIGEFSVLAQRVPQNLISILPTLSRNEAAVLRFLGWGRSNTDIGTLMNCNEATVRSHMNNAIRKLEMDGMRELNSLAGLLFHPVD